MASMEDMEQFVDWDKAAAAVANGSDALPNDPSLAGIDPGTENIGLVLANVDEDDFSFSALQHFSDNQVPMDPLMDFGDVGNMSMAPDLAPMNFTSLSGQNFGDTRASPCVHCTLGGYSCKTIQEGQYKGYCTSCVALGVECSFGGVVPDNLNPETTGFPSNPWPTMGEHPNVIPHEDFSIDSLQRQNSGSALDTLASGNTSENEQAVRAPVAGTPAKIGARFSRDSVRILKNWLSSHNRHPYPSDEEKEALQRQTGLNKTQITNWLANARRRGKVQAPRSTSPANWSTGAMDIPRRGTPALEAMNPLQRWQHSPPEHEPASATAIARAVTASSSGISSGLNSPFSLHYTDDGSGISIADRSSASSLGTSQSTGSRNSAYSHGSRNSLGSFGSGFNSRSHRRRRRRVAPKQASDGNSGLAAPVKAFQCTFCTDTFRTKHDWQRHEKSLHLSLERWVCTPDGPRTVNPETGLLSCVFCGLANPDDAHVDSHNHSACQERNLAERTFYRKDHLNQHLRLVHDVKFKDWSMKSWKVASPEIRSRCGFCGIVMDTWTIRTDHLAEHFKTGYSMADWKGDWGFEVPVLDMVENSIPPYLIHYERTSPLPYVASQAPPETPRNAYELIKLEMAYFTANHIDQHGRPPTDQESMIEGCRIIYASELLSLQGIARQSSWLRDLIMKVENLADKAKFGPLRRAAENRLATLKINGKDNLFEECPMEIQMQDFVRVKRQLGLTPTDKELQEEACRIVGRVEEVSTHPSEAVANWLLRLVKADTEWLSPLRRRAHLPRTEDMQHEIIRSTDPTTIDSTIHSYSRLERELADFLKGQRAKGIEPSDADLQREARLIIYEFDDGWNQTAADNVSWLDAFKERHPADGVSPPYASSHGPSGLPSTRSTGSVQGMGHSPSVASLLEHRCPVGQGCGVPKEDFSNPYGYGTGRKPYMFLNDANCYRRLADALTRWCASTMSPNNPNSHIPTDAEIQYQARWVLYDDDDPWNQTAADNAEWLQRFKRDVGIIKESGPGLPTGDSWALEQGGSGFAPPYASVKSDVSSRFKDNGQVPMRAGAKAFPATPSAANMYMFDRLAAQKHPTPTVFCSRELEGALVDMTEKCVAQTGRMPFDEMLRGKAREVAGVADTAADDAVLLNRFKEWMGTKLPAALPAVEAEDEIPAMFPVDMDLSISDEALGNMVKDMKFELQQGGVDDLDDAGGVSLLGMDL